MVCPSPVVVILSVNQGTSVNHCAGFLWFRGHKADTRSFYNERAKQPSAKE